MEKFVSTLFPWEAIVALYTHNGTWPLARREIALVFKWGYLRNAKPRDIPRTLTAHGADPRAPYDEGVPLMFNTGSDLRAFILGKKPAEFCSIHLGHVFMDGCKGRKWERANEMTLRPFVIDLDVDPIDRCICVVCPCRANKCCCNVCWIEWFQPRIRVMLDFLRAEGFSQLLMCFSGRKGVHIWVLDRRAYFLSNRERTTLCNVIENELGVVIDRDVSTKPNHLCKSPCVVHPDTLRIAVPIPMSAWEYFLPDQVPTLDTVTAEDMSRAAEIIMSVFV